METIAAIWNAIIIGPMINGLVLLYAIFFDNFGLSIIVFTIIVRGVMMPLTVKQSKQMKAMGALSPRLKEIQQRYSKDRQRASQETMKLYKEAGVNPLGCLGPMFVQFPIWIGLYQSILRILPAQPESLVDLSKHLYPWLPTVNQAIPIDRTFLGLDLAVPNPVILPILVGVSMWAMQKMTMMPAADSRQESTNRMMLWMMPLMFGFFTTSFPSGLAMYWIASNVVGIVIQGFVTGWDPLLNLVKRGQGKQQVATAAAAEPEKETPDDGRDRDDGKVGGRGDRNRTKGARRRSRRGRNRRR